MTMRRVFSNPLEDTLTASILWRATVEWIAFLCFYLFAAEGFVSVPVTRDAISLGALWRAR